MISLIELDDKSDARGLKNEKTIIIILIIISTILCVSLFADTIMYHYYRAFTDSKYDLFCAVYPYSYNNMANLSQSLFVQHIRIVREMGFKGVKLWNVECFYDEGTLSWSLDVIQNESLQVIIPLQYFNSACSFRFPSSVWERKGFMENDEEFSLFCEYVKNVSEIARSYINF